MGGALACFSRLASKERKPVFSSPLHSSRSRSAVSKQDLQQERWSGCGSRAEEESREAPQATHSTIPHSHILVIERVRYRRSRRCYTCGRASSACRVSARAADAPRCVALCASPACEGLMRNVRAHCAGLSNSCHRAARKQNECQCQCEAWRSPLAPLPQDRSGEHSRCL